MISITQIKHNISAVTLLVVAVFMLLRIVNNHRYAEPEKVIAWDVVSYYAYLPATFIEHDLSLSFTDTAHEGIYWPETLPDGRHIIKTSMGVSLMYLPFFLAGHVCASLSGFPANGFSQPYALALMLAGLAYCLLGLVLLRKVLLRRFSDLTTAATLVIIALCTNLYWYSVYEAPMSHAFSFSLFALFLNLSDRWSEHPSWWRTAALGLTLGLISLVRPTNVLIVIYFLVYCRPKIRQWPHLLLAAACTLMVWVPQMVYWYANSGQLFYYSYGDNERFFFSDPKLIEGLFSFRKGWLIYTPVMLFALLGIIPLWRRDRAAFWGLMAFLPVNAYVVFSWWCWWYGGGFGLRALIESYALLALPLAAWLEWVWRRRTVWRYAFITLTAAVGMLSAFHTLQYIGGAIHWDSMTRAAYLDSFLHKHPSDRFASLLEEPDYEAARNGIR